MEGIEGFHVLGSFGAGAGGLHIHAVVPNKELGKKRHIGQMVKSPT